MQVLLALVALDEAGPELHGRRRRLDTQAEVQLPSRVKPRRSYTARQLLDDLLLVSDNDI